MDPVALFAALAAAAAVVLVILTVFGQGRSAAVARIQQYRSSAAAQAAGVRVPASAKPDVGQLITSAGIFASMNRVIEQRSWSEQMARELARADLALKPAEYLAMRLLAVVLAVAISLALGLTILPTLANPLSLLVAAALGFLLPVLYINRRKRKRVDAFNAHLADTITLIANALRAGSSFLQSIDVVVREMPPPVSTEFARVTGEVGLGLTLEQALENMVRRVKSDDLELLATAVTIQYQVGGNLAEILDTIAYTIRERVRIKGEIRTLTAQQRLSGYVIGLLPIGLVLVLLVIAPRFMNPMFEVPPGIFGIPMGLVLLAFGGLMMLFGFIVIRRIVDIEV